VKPQSIRQKKEVGTISSECILKK